MVPNQPDDLRHLEAPARRRAQAPAQGARRHPSRRRRPHRAHRGRGRDRRRARARRRAGCATSGSRSRRSPRQSKPAKLLYQEPDLVLRRHPRGVHQGVPRRSSSTTARSTRRSRGYVEAIAPELADRVEFYDAEAEGLPIFERFHVSRAAAEGARPQGVAAVGRLAHHRAHRGAHRHRRQHRQERRQVEPRGDGLPQQPRGGRGGRPPAAAARHRRDHRHRLHRHGDQEEPRRGDAGVPRRPGPRQDPDPGRSRSRSWAWSR